jgi:hypothetical protein
MRLEELENEIAKLSNNNLNRISSLINNIKVVRSEKAMKEFKPGTYVKCCKEIDWIRKYKKGILLDKTFIVVRRGTKRITIENVENSTESYKMPVLGLKVDSKYKPVKKSNNAPGSISYEQLGNILTDALNKLT